MIYDYIGTGVHAHTLTLTLSTDAKLSIKLEESSTVTHVSKRDRSFSGAVPGAAGISKVSATCCGCTQGRPHCPNCVHTSSPPLPSRHIHGRACTSPACLHGLANARRLNDKVVKPLGTCQLRDLLQQVLPQCAANTPILKFYQRFLGLQAGYTPL
jgi:hypothetical protein